MKRKNRRNCGNKTRSLIRHIKIQYRLLAVFLLISLLPTICIGMYAYRVYTRAINSKISESALQTVRSLNTNMTIELEKISRLLRDAFGCGRRSKQFAANFGRAGYFKGYGALHP